MEKINKLIFIIGIIILLAGSSIAGFSYKNNKIITSYSGGDKIKGKFNISFSEEGDKLFTSNFLGEISLINFLDANNLVRGNDYTCSTIDCEEDFSLGSQATNLIVETSDDGKFIGFGINGEDAKITGSQFSVNSNVIRSCTNQFYIDVLGDGENIILNTKNDPNNVSCGIELKSGCFDNSASSEIDILSDRKYCEKITLPPAPSYYLGSKVRDVPGGSDKYLEMSLHDSETGSSLGTCRLPEHSTAYEKLKCVLNYGSFEAKEYFVCIKSESNVGYKIARETQEPRCGTVYTGGSFNNLNNDFEIFAESINYAGNPSIIINDNYYNSKFSIKLTDELDEYLASKYGRDCQNSDCVFPIKFWGNDQSFQFSNVLINYEESSIPNNLNQFKNLNVDKPLVSSGELELDLENADFTIPQSSSENKFKLFLNENLVFEKTINLSNNFNFEVVPRVVTFGQDVLYIAVTGENISNSSWNFGDGSSIQKVSGKQIRHSYTKQNSSSFELNVSLTKTNGEKSSKQFLIYVGNPKNLTNQTIKLYRKRIANLTSKIDNSSLWYKIKLREIIELDNMIANLNVIEEDFNSSVTDEDFQNVMLELIDLKIPYDIKNIRGDNNIPLSIGFNNFNVNYMKKIANKEYSDNNKLKNNIVGWMNVNYRPEVSYEHVAALYDFENEVLMSTFKIETNPIGSISEDSYLIFGQDIETAGSFKQNYDVKKISGLNINYVKLGNNNKVYEFLLNGQIEIENLGSYISPDLDSLPDEIDIEGECNLNGICEENEKSFTCPEDCSKRAFWFTIWGWIILFLIFIVVYIILQEWYKKKYEKKLFPNGADLYNMIYFIHNARNKGLDDGSIADKLKQNGWEGEKIRFGLRKIDGKRTGMFEIPLFKFIENVKVRKEIASRQAMPISKRYVNKRF